MRDKIRIHFIKRFIKKQHHKYQPNTTDTIETPIVSTAGILDGGTETPAETKTHGTCRQNNIYKKSPFDNNKIP